MTVSPVALRRQTERKPHPTARYWKKCDVEALFDLPFLDLVFQAAEIHRSHFNPREIQLSTLMSIKTGGCPEDCAYCPQSAHHNTNLGKEQMMDVDEIVCCGGIVGMNETRAERAGLIASLANLDPQPESVPINQLVKVEGTPLADAEDLDWTEFVRTIAVARITMPESYVRLSAGRSNMPESMQAMCFLAGANSIFYGDKLLTTENPGEDGDRLLMEKLNLYPLQFELEGEYQAAKQQPKIRVDY